MYIAIQLFNVSHGIYIYIYSAPPVRSLCELDYYY